MGDIIKDQFQQENDEVLNFILGERFFKPWADWGNNPDLDLRYNLATESSLEIFVTSSCNYKCEYCYLYNNSRIYPNEVNDMETILKNLEILFDFLIENNYRPKSIDFFSGEIWHLPFGWRLLDITLNAIKRGLKCNYFMIPSNCSFTNKKKALHIIQGYIDKFATYGVELHFSVSMDGKVIDDINRLPNDAASEIRDDTFYENIFLFARHNKYGFHPMVAACSIEYWQENFEWWKEQCSKYGMNVYRDLMLLEVRNNDWTPEKIQSYCDFIEYLLMDRIERLDGDLSSLVDSLVSHPVDDPDFCGSGYLPYYLSPVKTFASCTIPNFMAVRLGDLAICPCHRTAYQEHLYGKFVVENDKIVDIESNNIYNAIRILMSNEKIAHVKCDSCCYADYCIRGCFGSQLEQNNDPFLPIEEVCVLLKAKYRRLCSLYKQVGIEKALQDIKMTDMQFPLAQNILNFIRRIEEDVAFEEKEKKRNKLS